jgi:hypothetical protein
MLGRTLLSVVLATMFLSTGIIAMVPQSSVNGGMTVVQDQVSLDTFIEKLRADPSYDLFEDSSMLPADKIVGPLKEKMHMKMKVKIAIVTSDVRELALALEDYDYYGTPIGTQGAEGEVAVPIIEIDSSAVDAISALPGVLCVSEYLAPTPLKFDTSQLDVLDRATSPVVSGIDNYSTFERLPAFNHKADKAWDKGFQGEGVNVAIVDTGVDFAHPDLYGTQARDTVNSVLEIKNHEFVSNATAGMKIASMNRVNIIVDSWTLYNNGTKMASTDYTVFPNNGTVIFATPLKVTAKISASYKYQSPTYGWPIAFDPASMATYVTAVGANKAWDASWYANTSDNRSEVQHPIKVDGTNDFWPGEVLGVDAMFDGGNNELKNIAGNVNDYELRNIYLTQDIKNWYFGMDVFSNTTAVNYGVYIDVDQKYLSGAYKDPLGNYINTTGWDKTSVNKANATHMPEYAIYFNHSAIEWKMDPLTNGTSKVSDKYTEVSFFSWNNQTGVWTKKLLNDTTSANPVNGSFVYSGYKFDTGLNLWSGFLEWMLPKKTIGGGNKISLFAFTTGNNKSKPQDTTNMDLNVQFKENDWTPGDVTVTAFVTLGVGYFERFYDMDRKGYYRENVTMSYNVPPQPNANAKPLFGYHPDQNRPLTRVCVVDSTTPGVYDTVYVDLDNNKDFSNDKPCKKGDEISYFDFYNPTAAVKENYTMYNSGDGMADASGGMVYFIADGASTLPYLPNYLYRYANIKDKTNWTELKKYVPDKGTMVAFMGEFGSGESHGTMCASAVVGQGKTIANNAGAISNVHQVVGTAPNSKIVAICNAYTGSVYDAWLFAVEGYDGDISTSGDQPQIASNSFGSSSTYNDGYDTQSKFADWVTNVYGEKRTVFLASSGNDGNGYGSVGSPASAPGVISVGASIDFSNRKIAGLEGGDSYSYGDVVPFSSNGPSAIGFPEPDILANGRQAFGAVPLSQTTPVGGSTATAIWSGTSLSCPTASGVLALAYNAYYGATHAVKGENVIETSSNLSIDSPLKLRRNSLILVPGGYSIKLANATNPNGVTLADSEFTLYPSNGTLLIHKKVGIHTWINASYSFNHNFPDIDTARSIIMNSCDDIKYDILQQGAGLVNAERAVDIASNSAGVSTDTSNWIPGSFEGVKYEAFTRLMFPGQSETKDIQVTNHGLAPTNVTILDSVHKKTGEMKFNWTVESGADELWEIITNPGRAGSYPHAAYKFITDGKKFDKSVDGNEALWKSADMLKITISSDIKMLDPNGDGALEYSYWLDVYDWTDSNNDNVFDKTNPAYKEQNRMTIHTPASNVIEARIGQPFERTHTGLAIFIRKSVAGDFDKGATGIVWNVTLETFKKVDWNWLTLSTTGTVSLPVNGMTLTANVTIPGNAPVGGYEAGIYISEHRRIMNEKLAEATKTTVQNRFLGATNTTSKSVAIPPTATSQVDNATAINTSVRSVTNAAVINSKGYNYTNVPGATGFREPLVTTTSTAYSDFLADTKLSSVTGEYLGSTGLPVQIIGEYVGIAGATTSTMALDHGSSDDIAIGSVSLYKDGTYWADSELSVTNEVLSASYRNNVQLKFAHKLIVPGTFTIYKSGTPLVEGSDYTLNITSGNVTVLNLNSAGGVPITATYNYHSDYYLDHLTGALFFQTLSYKGAITADYRYFVPLPVASFKCNGDSLAKVVASSATIYGNGVPLAQGTDYVIDEMTRTATFLSNLGPNSWITASYDYYDPTSQTLQLSHGRDLGVETLGATVSPNYIWQNFTPSKANLLGFELYVDAPISNPLSKLSAMVVNETSYKSIPTTGGSYFTKMGKIYKILATGTIEDNNVRSGWNFVTFSAPAILNLNDKFALVIDNSKGPYGIWADIPGTTFADVCWEADTNTSATTWTEASYDLVFRTFNGYLVNGSHQLSDNGVLVTDVVTPVIGEVVRSVTETKVYGEKVTEFTSASGVWVSKLRNRYCENYPISSPGTIYNTYVKDVTVWMDGTKLVLGVDYSLNKDGKMDSTAYESDTGFIIFYQDYKSHYVAVNYTYYSPQYGLGAMPDMPGDNVQAPMGLDHGLVTTCNLTKAGLPLAEGLNYTLDRKTGAVSLIQTWQFSGNETVVGAASGGEVGPFNLVHRILANASLFLANGGTWTLLTEGLDYKMDYASGSASIRSPIYADNVTFMGPASGTETPPFNLPNGKLLGADIYFNNATMIAVVNETVATYTDPANASGPFYLANLNSYNWTFYVNDTVGGWTMLTWEYMLDPITGRVDLWVPLVAGQQLHAFYNYTVYEWSKLVPGVDYTIDMLTGQVLTFDESITFNDELHAFYNYTTMMYALNAGDRLCAFYNWSGSQLRPGEQLLADYSYHSEYVVDEINGDIYFAQPIASDSLLRSNYSFFTPWTKNSQLSVGTSSAGSYTTAILYQYRMYKNNEIVPQAGNYEVNNLTGTVRFLQPLLPNCAYSMEYFFYFKVTFSGLGNVSIWEGQVQLVNGSWTIYKNGVIWPYDKDVNYWINEDFGRIEFNGSWNPLPPNTWIRATYMWYPHANSVELAHGSKGTFANTYIVPGSEFVYNVTTLIPSTEYMLDYQTGELVFINTLAVLSPGMLIKVSYRYYDVVANVSLSDTNILRLNIYSLPSWTEMPTSGYTLVDLGAGKTYILFDPAVAPDVTIRANYTCYNKIDITKSVEFPQKYVVGGSWKVWNNYSTTNYLLQEGIDYEIYPTGVSDTTNASVKFLHDIKPDWHINITYSYYVPVTKAYLSIRNETTSDWKIVVGAKVLAYGTDYTVESYRGLVAFTNPLHPADVAYVSYNKTVTTTIPVYINVIATNPRFAFGGPSAYTQDLYNNSRVNAGMGGTAGTGDWRFYFVNVPDQGLFKGGNQNFYFDYAWKNIGTDVDAHVFGKSALQSIPAAGSTFPSDRYGPYTLSKKGSSTESNKFFTTTGEAREIVAAPITTGLNLIGMRTTRMAGTVISEGLSGSAGAVSFSSKEIVANTNQFVGTKSLSITSSQPMDGVAGLAAGPASPMETNETVKRDPWESWDSGEPFQAWLARGSFTRVLAVDKSALIFNVAITSINCTDLDLGIFLDGKDDNPKDGIAQVGEFISYSAGPTADEAVKLIGPAPGDYIIKVLGFAVPGAENDFHLAITLVQGEGFKVKGTHKNLVPANGISTLDVSWTLPGNTKEGDLLGALYVGPGNAPMFNLFSITLKFDVTPPDLTGVSPKPFSVITTKTPTISAGFSDTAKGEIDGTSMSLFVDGNDVTYISSAGAPLSDKTLAGGATLKGYWSGTISYKPSIPLAEGAHQLKVSGKDFAGNARVMEWTFTVDTSAPSIAISEPLAPRTYTTQDSWIVRGSSEPEAGLQVFSGSVEAIPTRDAEGNFFAQVALIRGDNEIRCVATDLAGHKSAATRIITLDDSNAAISLITLDTSSLTNMLKVTVQGTLNKAGTVTVNGEPGEVMSDQTFSSTLDLKEGVNTLKIVFTDLAGNTATAWRNVTRDTQAPEIGLGVGDGVVTNGKLNVTGTTEAGTVVSINGKPVTVTSGGSFAKEVALSYGVNTIVVESKDRAGNVAQKRLSISYAPGQGTNWAAIGLMIGLLAIGLFVGMLFMMKMGPKPEPVADEPEAPTDEEKRAPAEWEAPAESEEIPPVAPVEPIEVSEPEISSDLPPIPPEESMPEELPAVPEEPVAVPVKAAPAPKPAQVAPQADDMDPVKAERISKLKKALADGKISQDLYDKNIARIMAK